MAEQPDQRQQQGDLLQGDLLQGSLLQASLWPAASADAAGVGQPVLARRGGVALEAAAHSCAAQPAAPEERHEGADAQPLVLAVATERSAAAAIETAAEHSGAAAMTRSAAGSAARDCDPPVSAVAEPCGHPVAQPHPEAPAPARSVVSLPRLGSDSGVAAALPARPPERILILDTETTALDPAEGVCIEVGAVLFHVGQRAVLQQLSFLLPCESNPAERINAIPAAVTRLPQPWQAALACFAALVEAADAVVAHNAAFDRRWFGLGPLPAIQRPWICSMEDIRWPPERNLRATPSVRDLALAYGVPVWAAHRALSDCLYLVHVFERCADLEALLLAALEPRQLYRARLSYAERHRAREAGFRWNEPVAGAWSRRLSQREAEALAFPVEAVEGNPLSPPLARAS